MVTFKIYDLVGQELEVLVNRFQPAGDHQITWEAEGNPGGVYFYRLQTGEFSETKKLVNTPLNNNKLIFLEGVSKK